jgi:hypothetical protein
VRDRLREQEEKWRRGDVEGYWLYKTAHPSQTAKEDGKLWYRLPKPGQLWSVNIGYEFFNIGYEFSYSPRRIALPGDWIMVVSSDVKWADDVFLDRWVTVELEVKVLFEERVFPLIVDMQYWHTLFTHQDGRKPVGREGK